MNGAGRPAAATREIIAAVFQDLLTVPAVAEDDDFFVLGGHSMLAVVAITEVGDALGVEMPVRLIFDHPTLAGLADAVDRQLAEG